MESATRLYERQHALPCDVAIASGFADCGSVGELRGPRRERLLVDAERDPKLHAFVERARRALSEATSREAGDEWASVRCVVELCAARLRGAADAPSATLVARAAREVVRCGGAAGDGTVLLGELRCGLCRHRAVLLKYVCDELGMPAALYRGKARRAGATAGDGGGGEWEPHAWNGVRVGGRELLLDLMEPLPASEAEATEISAGGGRLVSGRREYRPPPPPPAAAAATAAGEGGAGGAAAARQLARRKSAAASREGLRVLNSALHCEEHAGGGGLFCAECWRLQTW